MLQRHLLEIRWTRTAVNVGCLRMKGLHVHKWMSHWFDGWKKSNCSALLHSRMELTTLWLTQFIEKNAKSRDSLTTNQEETDNHASTLTLFRVASWPTVQVFGLWEETAAPAGNPDAHNTATNLQHYLCNILFVLLEFICFTFTESYTHSYTHSFKPLFNNKYYYSKKSRGKLIKLTHIVVIFLSTLHSSNRKWASKIVVSSHPDTDRRWLLPLYIQSHTPIPDLISEAFPWNQISKKSQIVWRSN